MKLRIRFAKGDGPTLEGVDAVVVARTREVLDEISTLLEAGDAARKEGNL